MSQNREKWEREHARVAAVKEKYLERGLKDVARERIAKVVEKFRVDESRDKLSVLCHPTASSHTMWLGYHEEQHKTTVENWPCNTSQILGVSG